MISNRCFHIESNFWVILKIIPLDTNLFILGKKIKKFGDDEPKNTVRVPSFNKWHINYSNDRIHLMSLPDNILYRYHRDRQHFPNLDLYSAGKRKKK